MRFFKQMLLALGMCAFAATAGASPTSPDKGVDYTLINPAQPTDSGSKVEVTEFFWYSCPHCNAFDPYLAAWVKKQGNNIVFKRVPVVFRPNFIPQQKLYYSLEALGKTEELHAKIFHAIHVDKRQIDNDDAIANFVASQGIDRNKFLAIYNSFSVNARVQQAAKLQEQYGIEGVPTIAIDGRFETSPSMVGANLGGQPEATLMAETTQVMDWLVAAAAKDHKMIAVAPKK